MLPRQNKQIMFKMAILCLVIFTLCCSRVDIRDKVELKQEIDLKKIDFSDDTTFDVLLKNHFDKEIKIKYIQTGCGCLSYDDSILDQVIKPNDSLSLKFKYKPNTLGYNERYVQIFLDGHRTRLNFKLKCFVRNNIKEE